MRFLTEQELLLVAGGNNSSDITVCGNCHDDWPPLDNDPQDGDDGGGGGGGGDGGNVDQNHENFDFHERDDCKSGEALHVGEKIKELQNVTTNQYGQTGHVELGGIIVKGSDGLYGLSDDGIQTSHTLTNAHIYLPTDRSNIVGYIHNHPFDSSSTNINYINEYPSTDDWDRVDKLMADNPTINPATMSVYIVDPFGTTREFKYTDEAKYRALSDADKVQGYELPQAAKDCTP